MVRSGGESIKISDEDHLMRAAVEAISQKTRRYPEENAKADFSSDNAEMVTVVIRVKDKRT